ncbi:MAG: hypothetical protein J2P17_08445, partial [Mycobacterium sp.]|nr:hypothetical protein [Mycobacterium sp.]
MTIAYVANFQRKTANLANDRYGVSLKIGRLASKFRKVAQRALDGIIRGMTCTTGDLSRAPDFAHDSRFASARLAGGCLDGYRCA